MNCLMLALIPIGLVQETDGAVRALYDAGRYQEAVAAGRAVLEADPANREAHHFVGRALVESNYNLMIRDAIEHLEASMRGLPADHWMLGWSHVYIGRAYAMGGQPRKAIDRYELAIALAVSPECTAAARTWLEILDGGAPEYDTSALAKLYESQRYNVIIRKTDAILGQGGRRGARSRITDPAFYHYAGRAIVDAGEDRRLNDAIQRLETALDLADERHWITAWSHHYLGLAHERRHRMPQARRHFDQVLMLNVDVQCTAQARFRLLHLGTDPYRDWKAYTSAYVVLHYPPDMPLSRKPGPYARQLDRECGRISRALAVDPGQRIDVYVYRSATHGQQMLGRDPGWCDRPNQRVHLHLGLEPGRELAHCLSHRIAREPYCDSIVVREGLAWSMSTPAGELHTQAAAVLKAEQLPSFETLELSFNAREKAGVLAGSFVDFLLTTYSQDQFLAMWRDSGNGRQEQAFQRHYRLSSEQLSEAWKLFLLSMDNQGGRP